MGHFRESIQENSWLHDLARAEEHPEAEQLLQLGKSFDPGQLIEESTVEFLNNLKACFLDYARILNSYSETGKKFNEVKVYAVAQSAADFMLFRNQIKLIFSNTAQGVIQIAFAHHNSVTSQARAPSIETQELLAQMGPFRDIFWTYRGEKVSVDQIAKYYLTEFVRMTRDFKKSRAGNHQLIDQLRALLSDEPPGSF